MEDFNAIVTRNRKEADSLLVMELRAPGLAREVRPGQFVHMEVPTLHSHILRRPFSIYDADREGGTVEILYQVVGEGTADMAKWRPGYLTRMIGPIGAAWSPPAGAKRALLVGGGVGAAPLFMLCRQLLDAGVKVDVVLGAATADALVCRSRYEGACGCPPACSTDDGTFGEKGFATLLVEKALREAAEGEPYGFAAVCGPEPLMRAASSMTLAAGVPTQVSMERRMACGIGACLSCVVETSSGRRRACVDGPVFDASEVVW